MVDFNIGAQEEDGRVVIYLMPKRAGCSNLRFSLSPLVAEMLLDDLHQALQEIILSAPESPPLDAVDDWIGAHVPKDQP